MKSNIYDQFKRMLAIEMTSLLSKKVRWAHKQEQVKTYGKMLMEVVETQAKKRKSESLIAEIEQEQAGVELSKLETETGNKLLVNKVKNFDKKNFYFFDENKNTKNYLEDRSKER